MNGHYRTQYFQLIKGRWRLEHTDERYVEEDAGYTPVDHLRAVDRWLLQGLFSNERILSQSRPNF